MFPLYRVLLSLHIVAVISWMAGILYLFRLYVYHASETESVVKERFKIMESKLYYLITMPAALLALVMGILMLVFNPEYLGQHWMQLKLLFVLGLLGMTYYAGTLLQPFSEGTVKKSHKFFRVMNEVPTLLMIVIVFLVILRPF